MMECHYKVLGIDLDADAESIKKAYRKSALKYHPDKNPDNLEEATERFRLIQAAYDVLSDPQEKAWYDRHREEILHRKKFENYKNSSIDIFNYFAPSAYKGFGGDEKGFFSVYKNVFCKISSEDDPFRSSDSKDGAMPTFGDKDSNYDAVVHVFYSTWQAYSTKMSFVWKNQYDVKEAPNRRVARIIEKENKKERDKHKKKRNELVRELVAFVRKRDPRVKAHKVELERVAAEKTKKAEEHRASMLREKVKKAALYDETNKEEMMEHEERVAQLEDLMKDEFGFSSSSDDEWLSQGGSSEAEEYNDELFCVACNKLFKSEMGMANHKRSKKHKEKVNLLQEEMRDENNYKEINEKGEEEESGSKACSTVKLSKKQKKQRKQQQKLLSNMMSSEPISYVEVPKPEDELKEDKPKPALDGNIVRDSDEVVLPPSGGGNKSSNPPPPEEGKPASQVETSKQNNTKRQRRQNGGRRQDSETIGCGKCKQVFNSRNKLFQHLKQTGHSTMKPEVEGPKVSKSKGKKTK